MWVSLSEPRVPVRVETYDRRSARTETVDYIDWLRGLVIDDSFFEPPAQTKLMSLDYQEYARLSRKGPVGPVPVLYGRFLQSAPEQ